jgi:hypothetical protein
MAENWLYEAESRQRRTVADSWLREDVCRQRPDLWLKVGYMKLCVENDFNCG